VLTTYHAGYYVKEWLHANQKSQAFLASAMGVQEPFVSKIVNGHAHVTPKVAVKLEQITRVPAMTWMGYETVRAVDIERRKQVC
jgi:addiction module HigA family antidote